MRRTDAAPRTGETPCWFRTWVRVVAMSAGLAFSGAPLARSGITTTGDVTPDPATVTTSEPLYIGHTADGTMSVDSDSDVTAQTGFLGYAAGASGTATISGTGSTWTNSGSVYVGYSGSGTLDVNAGGALSSNYGLLAYADGSSGTATVAGAGSSWTNSGPLYVGGSWVGGGNAELDISGGAAVSNTLGFVGYASGSTAVATVSGAGSTWTNTGFLYVGQLGTGALSVNGGATVTNLNGYLGYATGSTGTATVAGPGSTWSNPGSLFVGYEGSGALTVSNGGQVTAGTLFASMSDLDGDGTVSAAGAVLDTDLVFDATHGLSQLLPFGTGGTLELSFDGNSALGVGFRGAGTLRIADGVDVTSSSGYVGYRGGSNGSATVSGASSTWTISGDLHVGSWGAGALTIEDSGAVVVGATTRIWQSGRVDLAGGTLDTQVLEVAAGATLTGTGTVLGDVNLGGMAAPGHDVGTLSIDGAYSQSADGTLTVELAAADRADLLAIDGTATLDGTLDVMLRGDYTPTPGAEWTVLRATGGITGSFASIPPGYQVSAVNGGTDLLLSVPLRPGDFNADGLVDRDDLDIFLADRGTSNPGLTDMDFDGDCDRSDLAVFLGHYGATSLSGEATGTPEPASLGLVLIGLPWLLRRHRLR